MWVVRQLFVAGHGPYECMLADEATRPGDGQLHLLGLTLDLHHDPLDEQAHQLLPVGGRGTRRRPQRRNVLGELEDLLALRRRQLGWSLGAELLVLLLQTLVLV